MRNRRSTTPPIHDPAIPTVLAARFVSQIRHAGGDPDALIAEHGLPRSIEQYPLFVLPLSRIVALGEAAAKVAGDPFLGVHAAERGRHDILHTLAFACTGVANGHEALRRYVEHVSAAHSTLLFTLQPEPGGMLLKVRVPGHPEGLGRHGNEHWVATVVLAARQLAGADWGPVRVHLAHPAPPVREELVRVLGTSRLCFDAGFNGITFDDASLRRPVRSLGDILSGVLDRFAARGQAVRNTDSELESRVRAAIEERLVRGAPSIQDIGRALGMSARTLQRRLTEEGLTFQVVLDQVRRDVALPQVQRGVPLSEIASRVGYTQANALFRSFRRWTGTTPRRAGRGAPDEEDGSGDATGEA